jgi:hypothetical protein
MGALKTSAEGSMRWSPEETAEVVRLWQLWNKDRVFMPKIVARFPGRSISSVRHLINRQFGRFKPPARDRIFYDIRTSARATEAMLAERDRRMSLPDTLQSYFGDPKPGSGQSALEQRRE